MRELTRSEVDQIGGGFGIGGAAMGAAAGLGGYVIGSIANHGTPNLPTAIMATSLGAVGGFTGNVAQVAYAAGMRGVGWAAGTASVSMISGSAALGAVTASPGQSVMGQGGGSE